MFYLAFFICECQILIIFKVSDIKSPKSKWLYIVISIYLSNNTPLSLTDKKLFANGLTKLSLAESVREPCIFENVGQSFSCWTSYVPFVFGIVQFCFTLLVLWFSRPTIFARRHWTWSVSILYQSGTTISMFFFSQIAQAGIISGSLDSEVLTTTPVDWGKCFVLQERETNISTLEEYPKFNFRPSWMTKREFWDDNLEQRYNDQLADPSRPSLKVIILPHSHNDPGWLKTFTNYFESATKEILTDVITQMTMNYTDFTFIWTEISFLQLWWDQANAAEQKVKIR